VILGADRYRYCHTLGPFEKERASEMIRHEVRRYVQAFGDADVALREPLVARRIGVAGSGCTLRVLGLPPGVVQLALIPTAYALGHDFKPAYRRPLNEIVHHDRW
jgi:hypothetical protein